MANFNYSCSSSKKNTGFEGFCEKIGLIKGYIITDDDVVFTEAEAQELANWQTHIQANEVYPFKSIMGIENQSDDPTYEDTPFATELVTNGKMSWRFAHTFSIPAHKAYFTHRSNSGRIIPIKEKGEYKGEEDENGNLRGFKLALLNVENLMVSDGSASEKTYIKVTLENADSVNRNIVTVVPTDHSGLDLTGLIDVRLSEVSASTSSITIEAANFYTGNEIDGFVEGDFTVLDSTGAAVSITTFTALTDGQYQFDATFTAGDYTIKFLPESMTTTGYATPNILTVTTS